MGVDRFICGTCQQESTDIHVFLAHKNICVEGTDITDLTHIATHGIDNQAGLIGNPVISATNHEPQLLNSGVAGVTLLDGMPDDTGQGLINTSSVNIQHPHVLNSSGVNIAQSQLLNTADVTLQQSQLLDSSDVPLHQSQLMDNSTEEEMSPQDVCHYISEGMVHTITTQLENSSLQPTPMLKLPQISTLTTPQSGVPQGSDMEQGYHQTYKIVKYETDSGPAAQIRLCDDVVDIIEIPPDLTQGSSTSVEMRVQLSDTTGHLSCVTDEDANKVKKKRGRPRKEKLEPTEPPIDTTVKTPTLGADGLYHCDDCEKSFKRERQAKSHTCLSTEDYIDSSSIKEDEEALDNDWQLENKDEIDRKDRKFLYNYPMGKPTAPAQSKKRGRPPKIYKSKEPSDVVPDFEANPGLTINEADEGDIPDTTEVKKVAPIEQTPTTETHEANKEAQEVDNDGVQIVQHVDRLLSLPEAAEKPPDLGLNSSKPEKPDTDPTLKTGSSTMTYEDAEIEDENDKNNVLRETLSIFTDEKERLRFEDCLNIDLSVLDQYLEINEIEQTIVTANGEPQTYDTPAQLLLYSCGNCNKLFKQRTFARMHVLTHTNLKPFRCYKCMYCTNTKGNLYTHMRKHTGQCYRCRHCDFQSANKGHVIEHEQTHSKVKQVCELCKKTYKTLKSLTNHVRVYHKTEKGKLYLQTFLGKQNSGIAILHQCHICNKKFKRKVDRDKHLRHHNIDLASTKGIFTCELCGYTSAKKPALDKHYEKHRLIYVCCYCNVKLPSSLSLHAHLCMQHGVDEAELATAFQQSIAHSMYYPEADWPENLRQITPPVSDAQNPEQKTVNAGSPNLGSITTPSKDLDLYMQLNYKPMTMDIYYNIKEMFGSLECEICGRLFVMQSELDPHMRTHTGEKPFACSQCSHRAISRDALRKHVEREHDKLTYVCNVCDYIADTRTQLWIHQQKHRVVNTECSLCNVQLGSVKKLKIHMSFVHPDISAEKYKEIFGVSHRPQGKIGKRCLKCPYCSKVFMKSGSNFQRHLWMHEGIRPFRCKLCQYSCRSQSNLVNHMLRHSTNKPFNCKHCKKPYKSKTALRCHERAHTSGKMFKCLICPYEATQQCHLDRHMGTHNVIKRYVCKHCSYSCNTLGYIKIHYSRFHRGETYVYESAYARMKQREVRGKQTNVFKCLSCDYLFGNMPDMKRHLKLRHNLKMADVDISVDNSQNVRPESPVEDIALTEDQASTHLLQQLMDQGVFTETVEEPSQNVEHHAQIITAQPHTNPQMQPIYLPADEKKQLMEEQHTGMRGSSEASRTDVNMDDAASRTEVNLDDAVMLQQAENIVGESETIPLSLNCAKYKINETGFEAGHAYHSNRQVEHDQQMLPPTGSGKDDGYNVPNLQLPVENTEDDMQDKIFLMKYMGDLNAKT